MLSGISKGFTSCPVPSSLLTAPLGQVNPVWGYKGNLAQCPSECLGYPNVSGSTVHSISNRFFSVLFLHNRQGTSENPY